MINNAKTLGVNVFIKAKDILDGNKKLNISFIAQLFNTCHGLVVEDTTKVLDLSTLEIDDVGDSREERVFRMWINSLNIEGVYVNNLFADSSDGVNLLKVSYCCCCCCCVLGRCCAVCLAFVGCSRASEGQGISPSLERRFGPREMLCRLNLLLFLCVLGCVRGGGAGECCVFVTATYSCAAQWNDCPVSTAGVGNHDNAYLPLLPLNCPVYSAAVCMGWMLCVSSVLICAGEWHRERLCWKAGLICAKCIVPSESAAVCWCLSVCVCSWLVQPVLEKGRGTASSLESRLDPECAQFAVFSFASGAHHGGMFLCVIVTAIQNLLVVHSAGKVLLTVLIIHLNYPFVRACCFAIHSLLLLFLCVLQGRGACGIDHELVCFPANASDHLSCCHPLFC